MHENRVPLAGQSIIHNLVTGPSTNGRSSAFGALCLGSNPSGPAKIRGRIAWVELFGVLRLRAQDFACGLRRPQDGSSSNPSGPAKIEIAGIARNRNVIAGIG